MKNSLVIMAIIKVKVKTKRKVSNIECKRKSQSNEPV